MENTTERRQEVRVPVELSILIDSILDGDKSINLPRSIPATITNISGGGVLLSTDMDIPENVAFGLKLDFVEDSLIVAQIIRKTKEDNKYFYGCKFLALTESDKQQIRKYIFNIQLKLKRK